MSNMTPEEYKAALEEQEHHIRLLGQLLGECIEAAGITKAGTPLTGPQLLMFGEDLKQQLLQQKSA